MPCGKRTFAGKHSARDSIKGMHETVRVYFCKECGGFHTTQERYDKVANSGRAFRDRRNRRQAASRRKGRE